MDWRVLVTDATRSFCQSLVNSFPELAPLWHEHRDGYDEILPHVFFGDLTRWVVAHAKSCKSLIRHLDEALRIGQPDVQNLIAVSFVENLPDQSAFDRVVEGVCVDAIDAEWPRQNGMTERIRLNESNAIGGRRP